MKKLKRIGFSIFLYISAIFACLGLIPATTAFADEPLTHTVIQGDTLWRIAIDYGTTVDDIKAANDFNSDLLQIGQVLVIPNQSSYSSVSRGGYVSRQATASPEQPKQKYSDNGELVSWPDVDAIFACGGTATLQDYETGKQFQIYRLFGSNHADCEPLSKADTSIMKEVFGGQWSWDRRAALLIIDGRVIAASMAGMPHGNSENITDNNFSGHFDLHFLNSKTHGSNKVDPDHQAAVRRAAGK